MKLIICLLLTLALFATEAARMVNLRDDNSITDEKPFHPFDTVGAAAAPIIRPDNTTKSRIPDDTLFREGPEEFEVGFDSLDNHLRDNALPAGPRKAHASDLGNLHPEEVFYADDDLLIIKGGGFQGPPVYEQPDSEQEDEFNFNELTAIPPNPHEEYNGNVPTIVRPPANHPKFGRRHRPLPSTPTYYPSPLALFLPARILPEETDAEPQYYYLPVQYDVRPVMPNYLWFLLRHMFPLYQPPRPALSLIGDTDVNFVDPRPPINPDAESIVIQVPTSETERYTHSHRRRVKPRL